MLTVFGIFFILLYFPHLNSDIEAKISLIVLQTCPCRNEVFEVNFLSLFGIFTSVAMKMASQKLSLI